MFPGIGSNAPHWFNRPLTHIVPFSLSDGATYERKIDWVYRYIVDCIVPQLDGKLDEWFEQYKTDHAALLKDIADEKTRWQELFDAFMADVVAQLEALNDQAAANLVDNTASKLRKALDANFASKETQNTVETGRLSASELNANFASKATQNTVETGRLSIGEVVPVKDDRVKIGKTALVSHTDDTRWITAIGKNAGNKMIDGDKTVIIGSNAMTDGEHSLDNVAIGDGALKATDALSSDYSQSSMEGTRNVGIGGNAGRFNRRGAAHTFIGRNAGQNVVGAQGVVAIGNGAQASRCPVGLSGTVENWAPLGLGITSTANVVSVGNWAGSRNTAFDITAIGAYALTNSTKSNANTAVGSNVMRRIDQFKWLDGSNVSDVSFGGVYDQVGNKLTLTVGKAHGAKVGDIAIFRLTSGGSKTFAQDLVFATVDKVVNSTVIEVTHPQSRTASGDMFMDSVSKQSETPTYSHENTGVGSAVLAFFDGGSANTAVGANAARNIKGGGSNTAVGQNAMRGISESAEINVSDNTAIGQAALYEISDGMGGNTAIGYRAGQNLRTGNDNTFIGRLAGALTFTEQPFREVVNSTSIGAGSTVSGDNQVQLGNSKTTTYAYGAVQSRSDVRDKAEIRDTVLGLEFIESLRPVDFKYNYREGDGAGKRFHHGLIAQEVGEIIKSTGVDFGGFQDHSVNGGEDVMSIGYTELVAPLIKAVQELSAEVAKLKNEK